MEKREAGLRAGERLEDWPRRRASLCSSMLGWRGCAGEGNLFLHGRFPNLLGRPPLFLCVTNCSPRRRGQLAISLFSM